MILNMCTKVCSLVAAATSMCSAQPCGSWLPGSGVSGIQGTITASTVWDPDGNGPRPELLIVAGSLELAGGTLVETFAAWDGQSWTSLDGPLNPDPLQGCVTGRLCSPQIRVLKVINDRLYAAGQFQVAPNSLNVAVFQAPADPNSPLSAGQWSPVGNGTDFGVYALGGFGPFLYAATINETLRFDLAAPSASWTPIAIGSAFVRDLFDFGGQLYRIGSLPTSPIDGLRPPIEVWTGTSWEPSSLGLPSSDGAAVAALNGELWLAIFDAAQPFTAGQVARRLSSGLWEPVGTGVTGRISSLANVGGEIHASGSFQTLADGTSALNITKFSTAAGAWIPIGPVTDTNTGAPGLAGLSVDFVGAWQGTLYAAGQFQRGGGQPALNVATLSESPSSPGAWNVLGVPGIVGGVQTIANTPFGLVIGGNFSSFPGSTSPLTANIAVLNGATISPLGGGLEATVTDVVPFANGVAALTSDSLASVRFFDGTSWTTLGSNPIPNALVPVAYSLSVVDGQLYNLGFGADTSDPIDLLRTSPISRWTGSGFEIVGKTGNDAFCTGWTAIEFNGQLVVGGNAIDSRVSPPSSVGFLNDDGSWTALDQNPVSLQNFGATGTVISLAEFDGELYAGGSQIWSQSPAVGLLKWDGASWTPVAPTLGSGPLLGTVYDMVVRDGLLFIAGDIAEAGNVLAPDVVAFNGTDFLPVENGVGPAANQAGRSLVRTIAAAGNTLFAGGGFVSASGRISAGFARFQFCGSQPVCNSLDFNNDGNIDPTDVDAYFSVLGEGPCIGNPSSTCAPLDFNNDGNIDPADVDSYFSVLGEGPCL